MCEILHSWATSDKDHVFWDKMLCSMVDKCSHLGSKCKIDLQYRRINQHGKKWRSGKNTGSRDTHRLLANSDASESVLFSYVTDNFTLAYPSTLKKEKATIWKLWCLYARLHGIESHRKVAFTVNVDSFLI